MLKYHWYSAVYSLHTCMVHGWCGCHGLVVSASDSWSRHRWFLQIKQTTVKQWLKPGFHYPSWRPELTARVDGWPVSITRQYGPCWRARISTSRVDGAVNTARQLGLLREIFTQQTQTPANRNARSKQWQPWLAACQRKRLRFLRFSFTQRTQRKRLRLNGNRAWVYTWTLTMSTPPP